MRTVFASSSCRTLSVTSEQMASLPREALDESKHETSILATALGRDQCA